MEQVKPPSAPIANMLGGILSVVGIGMAYRSAKQMKTFEQATNSTQLIMRALMPASEARSEGIKAGFEADLAGYGERAVKGVETGLEARGITDTKVKGQAVSATRAGLSGAYASARAALSRAKLSATTGLQSAVSQYQMDVAQKQYQSQLHKYYGQMGLWGALGGLGTSLLTAKNNPQGPKGKGV